MLQRTFAPYHLIHHPMKRKQLIFSLLLSFFSWSSAYSQWSIICNDLVTVTLDQGCTHTVVKEEILEGWFCTTCDYEVLIDKTQPYGNGPWVPAVLNSADMGKAYMVRVMELSTGNACWGNLKIAQKLDCDSVTTVNLVGGAPATLTPADMQVHFLADCFPIDYANTTLDGGTSITYDCEDLGVHIVSVSARDLSGNTAVCNTTVVVDDPQSECDSCLACPAAAQVSFPDGNALVTAYQSGDLSVFDAFGAESYNGNCTFGDTIYTVQYFTSAYGQNWFVREWTGLDDQGQPKATCEQVITFPFNHTISVSGHVYIDTLPDCQYSGGEPGITAFLVTATVLPSNQQFVVVPQSDGAYQFDIDLTGLDSMVRIQYGLPAGFNTSCPTNLDIPAISNTQQHTFDIGLQAEIYCPDLEVTMGTVMARLCRNNYFTVKYNNYGFLPAEDAYVTIQFDTLYQFASASIPWSTVDSITYTFQLGDIPALSTGIFYVTAFLDCDATMGQTVCNDVTIYPHDPCGQSAWDGPFIETSAYCDGDTVSLAVWNTGTQDMIEAGQYIVIEDVIMYREGNFQLAAGDSITLKMPATGSTWRIEADQAPGYPIKDQPSSAIEFCGGLNTPGLINAFAANESMSFFDRACETVVASCDPNDKNAVPTGYGTDHTIKANTDLEYKIRFQNTGTDTAFRVVIVDTLSSLLNAASIEAGASSHPYRLEIFPGGILHFIFDPIALPDSNVNEPASHGFVQFRIAQQPDLPDGTVLSNTAAIYFDFNDAVITNTFWHTIGKPFVTVDVDQPVSPGVTVTAQPNPFHEQTTLQVSGVTIEQGLFTLFDAQGKIVQTQTFRGNRIELERKTLDQGLYFFRINADGKSVAGGKLQAF